MKLTAAQLAALAAFAADKETAQYGYCVKPEDVRWQTVHALLARDLIKVASSRSWQQTDVVSNRFGRGWHTRSRLVSDVRYSLTDAGKAAIA